MLGPVGYLCLGMWRQALVILTGMMVVEIALSFAEWRRGSTNHTLPDVLTLGF